MKLLDLSFETPQENLACDEALLDWSEEESGAAVLRFWESPRHFVTLGYTDGASREADREACRVLDIPILRRCSGGGTVLQGPGCLNYALVMPIPQSGPLSNLSDTNGFIMQRHREVLTQLLGAPVSSEGFTDLAIGGLKFSGNAQRRRRRTLLFHGTFLLDFDLSLIERVLNMPSKQPQYRNTRSHHDFVTNIGATRESIKRVLQETWQAHRVLESWPRERMAALAGGKYADDAWNFKF
ncbi:MAG TPA: lipoate--protein ligase family protein [Abditibacteriaceae bacterium]|jgi:lipoate-protein ligase A